jgi:hypothetical protein
MKSKERNFSNKGCTHITYGLEMLGCKQQYRHTEVVGMKLLRLTRSTERLPY